MCYWGHLYVEKNPRELQRFAHTEPKRSRKQHRFKCVKMYKEIDFHLLHHAKMKSSVKIGFVHICKIIALAFIQCEHALSLNYRGGAGA